MIWIENQQYKLYGFAKIRLTMIFSILFGFLLYRPSSGSVKAVPSLKPTDLLPGSQDLKKWRPVGPPEIFTGEGLFDYIDGGAELYLEFNFKQVAIQEYSNDGESTLTIEVYEMDSPKNAYGIYSFDTRGEHPAIGQEATYGFGLLKFWKGRFFCRVLSLDQKKEIKSVIFSIGETIAAKISSEGPPSQILAYVPRENTVPESIHYFHRRVTLNNFYYLSNRNILSLNKNTEGAFFEYQLSAKPAKVIFIKYPRIQDSLAAFRKLINFYFPDKDFNDSESIEEKEIIRPTQNGEYAGIKLSQNYLILIFETMNKQICQDLLAKMARKLGHISRHP